MTVLTSDPGTYVLLMRAPDEGEATIGKLGRIHFDGGWLLYVGSAFGSGGLRARVRRHLQNDKTLHWHVDHLLAEVEVVEVWWTDDDVKREESWAEALRGRPDARLPLRRFGSGDCGCEGHLIHLPARPEPRVLPGPGEGGEGIDGVEAVEGDGRVRRAAPEELTSR